MVRVARLKGTTVNLTVIAVDSQTLDADKKAKNLQDAVDSVPAGVMLIVAGDWNAKPGPVDMFHTTFADQNCSWHEVR